MMNKKMKAVENDLYSIPLYGKKVGLNNIARLLDELDKVLEVKFFLNKTKVIHVTGTNGKGSVCKMLTNIYSEQGYSVGMFTSPHMNHIRERIQISQKNVDEVLFLTAYHCVFEIVKKLNKEDIQPTFFEWMFAIALYCFTSLKPDILVIEVGIGGRLDTTNILPQKTLSIITPIGLDHQKILGDTLSDIAKEKAGIISKKSKLVLYNQEEDVETIIDTVSKELDSTCYKVLPLDYKILESSQLGIDFSIHNKYYYYENLRLPVCAPYQIQNLGTALTAIEVLQNELPVSLDSIYKGTLSFQWPGRFEKLHNRLIVDGAHNELGASTLMESLKFAYENVSLDLVLAIKEGKNTDGILKVINDYQLFQRIYVVDLTIQDSVPKEIIKDKLKLEEDKVVLVDDLRNFLLEYLNNSGESTLIGAGSLYLVSEIREIILEEV